MAPVVASSPSAVVSESSQVSKAHLLADVSGYFSGQGQGIASG